MNRPNPQDIFGKNATPESIKKMYRGCSGCHSLFEYAQALDDYIDWMDSKKPGNEVIHYQLLLLSVIKLLDPASKNKHVKAVMNLIIKKEGAFKAKLAKNSNNQ